MGRTVQLNLRIEDELAQQLEMIARQESLRKSDIARKYLREGVRRWRLEQAIARYQRQKISLERAALEAGLSIYEMMDELRQRNIPLDQTTPDEVREEIRSLLQGLALSGW